MGGINDREVLHKLWDILADVEEHQRRDGDNDGTYFDSDTRGKLGCQCDHFDGQSVLLRSSNETEEQPSRVCDRCLLGRIRRRVVELIQPTVELKEDRPPPSHVQLRLFPAITISHQTRRLVTATERATFETWLKMANAETNEGGTILESILFMDRWRPVTQEEASAVASFVQWLGTNGGRSFLGNIETAIKAATQAREDFHQVEHELRSIAAGHSFPGQYLGGQPIAGWLVEIAAVVASKFESPAGTRYDSLRDAIAAALVVAGGASRRPKRYGIVKRTPRAIDLESEQDDVDDAEFDNLLTSLGS